MAETMGYAVGLSIGGTNCEFQSCDIKETREIVEDDGLRGTRTRSMERVAQGNIQVGGSITMQPNPAELTAVLPYVLSSSGSSFALSDTLEDVTVVVTMSTLVTYTYVGRFTAAHFDGAPGGKINLKLDFVGKTLTTSTGGAVTPPSVTARPYMFYDMGSGITLSGSTYSIDKFALSVDNKIVPTYMQGQTATDLEPTDRIITLSVQTKYTSTEAGLFTTAQAGPITTSPFAASIAFANSSDTLSFTFGALVAVSESVTVPGRQHLRLPLNYHCYGVGTTKEMITASS
jgi:hypothetical protein